MLAPGQLKVLRNSLELVEAGSFPQLLLVQHLLKKQSFCYPRLLCIQNLSPGATSTCLGGRLGEGTGTCHLVRHHSWCFGTVRIVSIDTKGLSVRLGDLELQCLVPWHGAALRHSRLGL